MPRGDNPNIKNLTSPEFAKKRERKRKKEDKPILTQKMLQFYYNNYIDHNWTYEKCRNHLKDVNKVEMSSRTFADKFKKYKDERQRLAQEAYSKQAQETAARDFKHLDTLIENCMKDYELLRSENKVLSAMKIVDRIKVLIELRRKFNLGIKDQVTNININTSINEVAIKIDLARKLGLPESSVISIQDQK